MPRLHGVVGHQGGHGRQHQRDDGADLDSIRKELAKKIAGFKMPRNFQLVKKMPREDSGKIKKRILRDNYLAEVSSSEERAS